MESMEYIDLRKVGRETQGDTQAGRTTRNWGNREKKLRN